MCHIVVLGTRWFSNRMKFDATHGSVGKRSVKDETVI